MPLGCESESGLDVSSGVGHAYLQIHCVFIIVCMSLHPWVYQGSFVAIVGLPSGSQSPRSERPHALLQSTRFA